MKKFAIIIPAFNERENLGNLTKKILKYLPECNIFIVDDTKDKSQLPRIKKNIKIKYFLRKNKKGRGSAILFGLKKAIKSKKFDFFIEMDADFSHRPSELKKNIRLLVNNEYDLLIASRYLKKSKIINWPIGRKILSKLSNLLARALLNIKVSDYTNGYRFYSRRSAKLIISKCGKIGDGFIILSEILLIISKNNYKIGEIYSTFINRKRGQSSVSFELIFNSLLGLLKLFLIRINIYSPYN